MNPGKEKPESKILWNQPLPPVRSKQSVHQNVRLDLEKSTAGVQHEPRQLI